MESGENAKTKAATTYNAASDYYDNPVNSFWERFGRRTIQRLNLSPGAQVLDVCCGSGASAIPCAETVGSDGFVLGVDLAENLLELAREKAQQRGLTNIEFRTGDMLNLGLPESRFDAVVCVFGIFFVPDMSAAVRELWKRVRVGGKLAITTWGPRLFEPANSAFWNSIRGVRPELYKGFNPWDRISDTEGVRSMFSAAGIQSAVSIQDVQIVPETGVHKLSSPEAWWTMVLGSGYRGTVAQLNEVDRERVRQENLDFIRRADVHSVEANVVYAVAVRGVHEVGTTSR
jgi:ubiquinone/menaquinone biosynthesis C-methylase UbiE